LIWWWWCYPNPRRNSTETQHSGHAQRSGPEIKNGRSGANDGAPERLKCGSRDDPEGGELDPAVDVRRRCEKNSPSGFLAQTGGQKKTVTVPAKSGQFTAGEVGKGPVSLRKPKEFGKREN